MRVAKVIVDLHHHAIDKEFSYKIPEALLDTLEIGSVVLVPFGQGNKLRNAYVVDLGTIIEEKLEYQIKEIHSLLPKVAVENELIRLAYWMKSRYHTTFSQALSLMVPPNPNASKKTRKVIQIEDSNIQRIKGFLEEQNQVSTAGKKHSDRLLRRMEVLRFFLNFYESGDNEELIFVEKEFIEEFGVSAQILKKLSEEGYLTRKEQEYDRKVVHKAPEILNPGHTLNLEQEQVIQQVWEESEDGQKSRVFLLHGITGSGKTEVYMKLVEETLQRGKEAIVLIPEISLTPQTIRRFVERFGNVVGVSHSRLNPGERYEQWLKAKNGEIRIMVGARSAVFTPFSNLGLIIIDEEHEHTYKSENSPRYHAREVAIYRASQGSYPVLLGSATPLVESYYKALHDTYYLLELRQSAVEKANKEVYLVDMRKELESGNKSVLSHELFRAMTGALERKEQVILFLNRRGYANFISCRSCGYVYKCEDCDVSMTYHAYQKRLICHYCGKMKVLEELCPVCKSPYIKGFGAGTQKIEQTIERLFENYRIERMDQDTTGGKHAHEEILERFRRRETDILIGTQMLAKGHDFHNVTVVGVLAADLSLNQGDYRAAEKTFQLLTQVIGRTGRGELSGKAFIQTYDPEHFALQHALHEDYISFYQEEISMRKAMVYPPFCYLVQCIAQSYEEKVGYDFLKESVEWMNEYFQHVAYNDYIILGPAKTTVSKVKNIYRYRLLIKGSSYKMLTNMIKELYNRKENDSRFKDLRFSADMNPMNLI
ncbi:MAG: primosomal protein N' [Vallitaleaceae bacterium]|nr:primosomal protein N' [Vallitaleaceae bacterium]